MPTFLSDVPWEKLRVGQKVRSVLGNIGIITKLFMDRGEPTIEIRWEGIEHSSVIYHYWGEHIIFEEKL
ncbi:MAG: hypothetical protein A3G49_04710 [Candidatus Sungbacteria bacterium RIFCSPLOWO2_12_FULL_41_11]|uniref:DUF4314 domain-containing protein n=1 Tax=Candidatus Sungbacteria bacterium RIFCSPLOWO2_12_FULL_41_11 TaxID=1802286 RepID=A0A1G2LP12_9BACT|nr:MAG: hypothetical protein UV01_C0010G0078 [Parcubacteria group bacterium GW2011_GWA2_42_14]OHA00171.1 MAG: hypothetical protein A3D41_02395 [Candidatus Sungbacteria bacterium RIFCSPHIGHO2_02_FULL_41_12b]OHA12582.1 MAG: hypothetical protein A3G49_04710 [Candidatus Sungbacteria bacterium RIFCSPLOWO2_12_FULL_41_11]